MPVYRYSWKVVSSNPDSILIDAAADFVSTLADLGAGASAGIAAIAIFTVTVLANAAAMHLEAGGIMASQGGLLSYIKTAGIAIAVKGLEAAANIALIGTYVILAALIALVIWRLIKAKNARKEYMDAQHVTDIFKAVLNGMSKEKAEAEYQKMQEQIAQAQQRR